MACKTVDELLAKAKTRICRRFGFNELPLEMWFDLESRIRTLVEDADGNYSIMTDQQEEEDIKLYVDWAILWGKNPYRGSTGTVTPIRMDSLNSFQDRQVLSKWWGIRFSAFNPYERQRIKALSRYYARKAWNIDSVKKFRSLILSNRWLSKQSAQEFLSNNFYGLLPLSVVMENGPSAFGESTQMIEKLEVDGKQYARIKISDSECIVALNSEMRLYVEDEKRNRYGASMVEESVFYWLDKIARELSKETPWRHPQAAWFVLTGRWPKLLPIEWRADYERVAEGHRSLLTLTIEPWVSAITVANIYQEAQLKATGMSRAKQTKSSIEVFNLVTRHKHSHKPSRWAVILEKIKLKRHYGTYNSLRFVYSRIHKKLFFSPNPDEIFIDESTKLLEEDHQ